MGKFESAHFLYIFSMYIFLGTIFSYLDEKRPNVYLSIEMTSGFLRVRHSGSTIYSKQRLAIDVNHTISVIIGHMVNIPENHNPKSHFFI